jgi:hypothetical protein
MAPGTKNAPAEDRGAHEFDDGHFAGFAGPVKSVT